MKAGVRSSDLAPDKGVAPARAKSPALTPWFSGDVRPARKGVYERMGQIGVRYSHWNGAFWGLTLPTPEWALQNRNSPSHHHHLRWRGLASDPAKDTA
jgi:hypothetical protein